MYLHGLSASVPAAAYPQAALYELFARSAARHRLKARSQSLMAKILKADNGIETRHLALENLETLFDLDAEALNHAFEKHAPALAADALRKGLDRAGVRPADLDALFICTCTGYLCPGLSSHVAEALNLSPEIYLHDLVGMGCGAALPTLRAAQGFVAVHPNARVAVVAVEICSAAFYLDDDPGVLISASLFGDGAACVIVSGSPPHSAPGWRAENFMTVHQPEHREHLRFGNRGGKLRNQLARSVPAIAAASVRQLYDNRPSIESDASTGLYCLAHPGGRDVVNALAAAFDRESFAESRWILRNGGNLSSPSILFALGSWLSQTPFADRVHLPRQWLDNRPATPHAARRLWLTSFGAGFSAHACEWFCHDA